MDFIELLLGISPDGGNGSLEVLLFIAAILAAMLARSVVKRSRRWSAS